MSTFTYSGYPAVSDRDAIRLLIGDTDESEVLLYDEELDWLILTWETKGSLWYTASMVARTIAAKFAREVTTSSDSQTVNADGLQQKYLDLSAQLMLQHQLMLAGGMVDVGGLDPFRQFDPSIMSPAFGTGMHDSYEVGQQDLGDFNGGGYDPLTGTWWR